MKHKITLVPEGGLGNRMRTMVSGMLLARAVGARLEVLWFRDWGLGCRFDTLFRPLALPDVCVREATGADAVLRDRPRRRNLWLPRVFEHWRYDVCIEGAEFHNPAEEYIARCKGRDVWISSCGEFMSGPATRAGADSGRDEARALYGLFRPQDDICRRVSEQAALFGERTVGVHLRRTDNVQSVSESPTELFIRRMEEEPGDTVFFLATDSEADKRLLRAAFPSRLITSDRQAERGTTEGMRQAVAELFLLSRTRRILGSYYSSFSEIASYISGIELEIIRKP